MMLTAIIASYQTDDCRPNIVKNNAGPAIVERLNTAGDREYVVSGGLYDIMYADAVGRKTYAEQSINDEIDTMLTFAYYQNGVIGIQCSCQATHNRDNGSWDTQGRPNHQFNLDIAPSHSIPPVRNIICWPDDCIDEVEEVAQDDPRNEANRRKVALDCMEDEGRNAKSDSQD